MKTYLKEKIGPVLLNITILTAVYSLLRGIFYICNTSCFLHVHAAYFIAGIRFDLSAIAYLNIIWCIAVLLPFSITKHKVYQLLCNIYFVITNSLGYMLQCIDIAYFPYVSKRLTFDVFSYLDHANFDFHALLPLFLTQFWYLVLLWIALTISLIYMCKLPHTKLHVSHQLNLKNLYGNSLLYILTIFTVFSCMRGGWQLRPLSPVHAGKYAPTQYTPLVLNTPFTFITTIGQTGLKEPNYFNSLQQAELLFSPIHTRYECDIPTPKVKNIVFIIWEGLSQELLQYYHPSQPDYPSYCPFTDSLARKAWVYNGIANGRRTMEGIPAILCGYPALMESSYMESPYATNIVISPIEILAQQGYNTCFFHGAKNGSMNFESYCKSIGYKQYFGMYQYPDAYDYDGNWGISDRSYLKYMAQVLDTLSEPFFASVLTLSSHHPFTLPNDAGNYPYPQGTHPMHRVSAYTDKALSEFFHTIEHTSWYKHTLFVITGDHAYQGSYSPNNNTYTAYLIPVIFYHPMADTAFYNHDYVQQTDIMPSLFAYMNIQQPLLCYGQNIFHRSMPAMAFNYLLGNYQIFYHQYLLQYNGEQVTGLYYTPSDSSLSHNIVNQYSTQAIQDSALLYLQAVIQSYNYRMIHNMMTTNPQ